MTNQTTAGEAALQRCAWAGGSELMRRYHDQEWGTPRHDDRILFEFLILEGAQAGLSWETILKRRESYRRAFEDFDLDTIAAYGEAEMERLLTDAGIIRNRAKIMATVANARAVQRIQKEFGSFDAYLWQFVEGTPRINRWTEPREIPAETAESRALSKELKKRGLSFVGPTIVYAFMQATGMVNDHVVGCFRSPHL